MGLEYIQLFKDMEALFEPYDDAQRGRLIMAMMAYAYRGEEPHFDGVEKFIWAVLRQHIDRCAQNVEAKKAAGSKGGKRKTEEKQIEAEASTSKQTEAESSRPKQNAHNQDQDHDNDHDHKQDHKEKTDNARATAADEPVTGIDGEDLSADIRNNAEVDVLLKKYRMPEAVRGDLLDDIAEHGLDKVKRVMQEAARSDTRGGLSLNFYRACLKNDGKQRAAPSGKGSGDQMLRYTPEERKKNYSAAVLDFDEGD